MVLSCRCPHQILPRGVGLLFLFAVVAATTGCGNGLPQVAGQVTLDGQPVKGGKEGARVLIQFLPANGVGPNGVGLADENGNYNVGTGSKFGVPPGDYLVTCSVSESSKASAAAANHNVADPKFGDAKTSGLRCTVASGRNRFDIPLTSASKSPPRHGN